MNCNLSKLSCISYFQPQNIDSKINTPPRIPIPSMMPTAKGVENAKKMLRAFSIQKKTPMTPIITSKPSGSGSKYLLILF